MIKFYGKIDECSRRQLRKRNVLNGISNAIIPTSILMILSILAWIFAGYWYFFLFILLCEITGFIIYICTMREFIPKLIIIDEKEVYIEFVSGGCAEIQKVEDVKSVVDYGSFYAINFYFCGVYSGICQKDLLIEGSLEEFETLFEDKLIRQNDN